MNDRKLNTQLEKTLELLKDSIENGLTSGVPADRFLAKVFRENRSFGSRDRRTVNSSVFAYYRRRGWLAKAYPEKLDKDLPILLTAAFAAEGNAPEFIKILCAKANVDYAHFEDASSKETSEERFKAFTGVAVNHAELLEKWMIEKLSPSADTMYLPYLDSRPPVWIRTQNALPEYVSEMLMKNNDIASQQHPFLKNALKLDSERPNLYESAPFRRGLFEIQDFSSQCIGFATCAKENETWFDPCAGGGGKTLQIASMMRNTGKIFADDIRKYKLIQVAERAKRASFTNVSVEVPPEDMLFDGVIVDAPCSSSGRWRRNPDAICFAKRSEIEKLPNLQLEILEKNASRVKPGGVLVYGTCSVFDIENRGVVERFLEKNGDEFTLEPFPNPHRNGEMTDGTLATFPAHADCDGAFSARFRRKN